MDKRSSDRERQNVRAVVYETAYTDGRAIQTAGRISGVYTASLEHTSKLATMHPLQASHRKITQKERYYR